MLWVPRQRISTNFKLLLAHEMLRKAGLVAEILKRQLY